jgi:uncharacterized protein YggU (UPF0235/DUF167 family)
MRQDEPMSEAPLTFAVRVRPGASRTRVGGRYDGARGAALVVAVTARAVDGAATGAVLAAVAEALGVRRAAVGLHSGRTSRDKVLTVEDPPPELSARLASLRDGPAR